MHERIVGLLGRLDLVKPEIIDRKDFQFLALPLLASKHPDLFEVTGQPCSGRAWGPVEVQTSSNEGQVEGKIIDPCQKENSKKFQTTSDFLSLPSGSECLFWPFFNANSWSPQKDV